MPEGKHNAGKNYVTPAHVRTYGASRTDYGNIVPLCYNCHMGNGPQMYNGEMNAFGCFEEWPTAMKVQLLPYAEQLYERYCKESSCQ